MRDNVYRQKQCLGRQGDHTVDSPITTQDNLNFLGESLRRSMHRHLVDNPAVQAAFKELAFEVDLARQLEAPALLDTTA